MKKTDTTSTPIAAAPAPAVPAKAPVLDLAAAKAVAPYRHEKTARTAAYHQPAGEEGVHLFSATGNFIATVSADEAAAQIKLEVEVEAPAPAPAAESAELKSQGEGEAPTPAPTPSA